eukprot:3114315-Amphidinium_carterae.1
MEVHDQCRYGLLRDGLDAADSGRVWGAGLDDPLHWLTTGVEDCKVASEYDEVDSIQVCACISARINPKSESTVIRELKCSGRSVTMSLQVALQ